MSAKEGNQLHSLNNTLVTASAMYLTVFACNNCINFDVSQIRCQWETQLLHLTTRVVGAPMMILQPVSSIFPCSPLPSGTCRTPGLSIPYVFPPLPLSALSSSLFHCALQDGFGQTWWTENTTIPLQFASLYDRQDVFVWSNCLLDLGTDFLVGNMVFVWDV